MNPEDVRNIAGQVCYFTELVGKTWEFDAKTYPELATLSGEERDRFVLNHVLLHLLKSMGKIATALEAAEHGKPFDQKMVQEVAWKLLVNALQVANISNMTPQQVAEDLAKWIESKE